MDYLLVTILIVLNACWLALVLFALPGNWLIVISTAMFAWWRWEEHLFSPYTLVAITVLAVLGEIIEFFAGMGGAKKAGAGWKGAFAAILGAIAGAIVATPIMPVVGTMIGACAGAAIATWAIEIYSTGRMDHSVRTGVGAGLGVLLGTTAKLIIGIVIWLTVAISAFWP